MSKSKLIVIILALSGAGGVSCFAIHKAIKSATQETIKIAPDLPGAESYGDDNYGLVHLGYKTFGLFQYDGVAKNCKKGSGLTGNKCETPEDLEAYEPNKGLGREFYKTDVKGLLDYTSASKEEIKSQYNVEFGRPFYEDLSVDVQEYMDIANTRCQNRATKDPHNKCTLSDLRTYARIETAIGKLKKQFFPETEDQTKARHEKYKQEMIRRIKLIVN